MRRYDIISEICDAMLGLGWKPFQNDHEDANGKFEINWEYDDALATADKHSFFKFMVKVLRLLKSAGCRATFMPKPFKGLTGNGCHCHISVWDLDGRLPTLSPTRRRNSAYPAQGQTSSGEHQTRSSPKRDRGSR